MTAHRSRFAAATLVVLAACGRSSQPAAGPTGSPKPTPSPTTLALKVISNSVGKRFVTMTETRRGRKVYLLRADANESVRFSAGTGRSVFTRPHIIFYEDQGKTLTADAPVATVEEQTKTVLMSGGVHARTQDGIVLTCDTMSYDDRTQRIHGTGNVLLTTPRGESLAGDTIDADVKLDHVRVTGAPSTR